MSYTIIVRRNHNEYRDVYNLLRTCTVRYYNKLELKISAAALRRGIMLYLTILWVIVSVIAPLVGIHIALLESLRVSNIVVAICIVIMAFNNVLLAIIIRRGK